MVFITAFKDWLSVASPGLSNGAANSESTHHVLEWRVSLQNQQNFFARGYGEWRRENRRVNSVFFAGEFLSKNVGNSLETFHCKSPCRRRNRWCPGPGAVMCCNLSSDSGALHIKTKWYLWLVGPNLRLTTGFFFANSDARLQFGHSGSKCKASKNSSRDKAVARLLCAKMHNIYGLNNRKYRTSWGEGNHRTD